MKTSKNISFTRVSGLRHFDKTTARKAAMKERRPWEGTERQRTRLDWKEKHRK